MFLSKVEQSYSGLSTTASALVLEKPNINTPLFLLLAELHRKNQKARVNLMRVSL